MDAAGSEQSSMLMFLPQPLLARFAFGIVDRAGDRGRKIRCRRRQRDRGDGVELAVGTLQRRFLDMRGATRTQIVGGLQSARPCQAVKSVKLLAGGIGDV